MAVHFGSDGASEAVVGAPERPRVPAREGLLGGGVGAGLGRFRRQGEGRGTLMSLLATLLLASGVLGPVGCGGDITESASPAKVPKAADHTTQKGGEEPPSAEASDEEGADEQEQAEGAADDGAEAAQKALADEQALKRRDATIAALQQQLAEARKLATTPKGALAGSSPGSAAPATPPSPAPAAGAAVAAGAAGADDACSRLARCCAELAKTAPSMGQSCAALQAQLGAAAGASKAALCGQAAQTLGGALAAIPNVPTSCVAAVAPSAAGSMPAAPPAPASAPVGPAGTSCDRLNACCADAKGVEALSRACAALRNAVARVPASATGLLCDQGFKTLRRAAAALPGAPISCTGKAAVAPAAAGAQPSQPTPGDVDPAPTPPGGAPDTPATDTAGPASVEADGCRKASACCEAVTPALPQLSKLCETLSATKTPQQCAPVLKGLRVAAGALPQLGKPVPRACK